MSLGLQLGDMVAGMQETAVAKRKRAFKDLVSALENDPNARAVLTANADRADELNWLFLTQTVIEYMISDAKINKTQSSSVDAWSGLAAVIAYAERDGHFLGPAIHPLCDAIKAVIGDESRVSLLVAHVSSILRLVLSVPTYARQLSSAMFRSFFQFFSTAFLSPEHAQTVALHSLAFANVVVGLMSYYPYAMPPFVTELVFPFYSDLFISQPADNNSTILLLDGLNRLLALNVMSVIGSYRPFCRSVIDGYMAKNWASRRPTFKRPLTDFLRLALRVSNYLPDGIDVFHEMTPTHALYRALIDDLSRADKLKPADLSIFASIRAKEEVLSLSVADHSFLLLCTELVWKIQSKYDASRADGSAPPLAPPPVMSVAAAAAAAVGGDKKEDKSPRKKRKTSAANVWDSILVDPTVPWLQFLFVFLVRFPQFFCLTRRQDSSTQSIVHYRQLMDPLLRSLASRDIEMRKWSLVCLSRMTCICAHERKRVPATADSDRELWHTAWDVLIGKFLLNEDRTLSRLAALVLSRITAFGLVGADRLSQLHSIIWELPEIKHHLRRGIDSFRHLTLVPASASASTAAAGLHPGSSSPSSAGGGSSHFAISQLHAQSASESQQASISDRKYPFKSDPYAPSSSSSAASASASAPASSSGSGSIISPHACDYVDRTTILLLSAYLQHVASSSTVSASIGGSSQLSSTVTHLSLIRWLCNPYATTAKHLNGGGSSDSDRSDGARHSHHNRDDKRTDLLSGTASGGASDGAALSGTGVHDLFTHTEWIVALLLRLARVGNGTLPSAATVSSPAVTASSLHIANTITHFVGTGPEPQPLLPSACTEFDVDEVRVATAAPALFPDPCDWLTHFWIDAQFSPLIPPPSAPAASATSVTAAASATGFDPKSNSEFHRQTLAAISDEIGSFHFILVRMAGEPKAWKLNSDFNYSVRAIVHFLHVLIKFVAVVTPPLPSTAATTTAAMTDAKSGRSLSSASASSSGSDGIGGDAHHLLAECLRDLVTLFTMDRAGGTKAVHSIDSRMFHYVHKLFSANAEIWRSVAATSEEVMDGLTAFGGCVAQMLDSALAGMSAVRLATIAAAKAAAAGGVNHGLSSKDGGRTDQMLLDDVEDAIDSEFGAVRGGGVSSSSAAAASSSAAAAPVRSLSVSVAAPTDQGAMSSAAIVSGLCHVLSVLIPIGALLPAAVVPRLEARITAPKRSRPESAKKRATAFNTADAESLSADGAWYNAVSLLLAKNQHAMKRAAASGRGKRALVLPDSGAPVSVLSSVFSRFAAELARDEQQRNTVFHARILYFVLQIGAAITDGSLVVEEAEGDAADADASVDASASGVGSACRALMATVAKLPTLDRHSRLLLARCVLEPTLNGFKGDFVVRRLIRDPDFVVRLLLSTQVASILEQFEKKEVVYDYFFTQSVQPLKSDTAAAADGDAKDEKKSSSAAASASTAAIRTEDGVMTALATLGQLCLSNSQYERQIVWQFCWLWHTRSDLRFWLTHTYNLVSAALRYDFRADTESVSSLMGSAASTPNAKAVRSSAHSCAYEQPFTATSPQSLADDHFEFVFSEWLASGVPMSYFPFLFFSFHPLPQSYLCSTLKLPKPSGVAGAAALAAGAFSSSAAAAAAAVAAPAASKKRHLNGDSADHRDSKHAAPATVAAVSAPSSSDRQLRDFFFIYQSRIVPIVYLALSSDAANGLPLLKQIADSFAKTPREVMEAHFPLLFARFYVLYHPEYARAEKLRAELSAIVDFTRHFGKRMDDFPIAVLDLVTVTDKTPLFPNLTFGAISYTITQLAASEVKTAGSKSTFLCRPGTDRIQRLILHLRRRMADEFRVVNRLRLYEVFRWLITRLISDSDLRSPAILRPILDTVLWLLPHFDEQIALAESNGSIDSLLGPPPPEDGAAAAAVDTKSSAAGVANGPIGRHHCALLLQFIVQTLLKGPNSGAASDDVEMGDGKDEKKRAGAAGAAATKASSKKPTAASRKNSHITGIELAPHLQEIIAAAVAYATAIPSSAAVAVAAAAAAAAIANSGSGAAEPDFAASYQKKKERIALSIITDVFAQFHVSLKPFLIALDPLPSTPVFRSLNETYASLCGTRTLEDEIQRFMQSAYQWRSRYATASSGSSASPSAASSSLICGLQHLYTQLQTRQPGLNLLLSPTRSVAAAPTAATVKMSDGKRRSSSSSSAAAKPDRKLAIDGDGDDSSSSSDGLGGRRKSRTASSGGGGGTVRMGKGWKVVSALVGVLMGLCRPNSSSTASTATAELAAKCLGEIGAVDPQLLNRNGYLSSVVNATSNAAAAPLTGSAFSSALAGGGSGGFNPFDPAASPNLAAISQSPLLRRLSSPHAGARAEDTSGKGTTPEVMYASAHHHRRHHAGILSTLNQYLSHSSHPAPVMVAAADTLRTIFRSITSAAMTEEVDRAFDALDPATQQYLLPYNTRAFTKRSSSQPTIAIKQEGKDGAPKLREKYAEKDESVDLRREMDMLWQPPAPGTSGGFGQWISSLTNALLRHKITDQVLVACAPLCVQLPDFAAKLFPIVIFEILDQNANAVNDERANASTRLLATRLNALADVEDAAYLSVIFSALHYARKQQSILLSQNTSVIVGYNYRLLSVLTDQFDASLDYLRFARAAQHCSSYFTSVLLLEKWHFRTFGQLKMVPAAVAAATPLVRDDKSKLRNVIHKPVAAASSSSSGGSAPNASEALTTFQNLLMHAYKNISEFEPDSMYGVVACRESERDVVSDVWIAEHEGSWPKALQLYDFMFQRPTPHAPPNASATAAAGAAVAAPPGHPVFSPPPVPSPVKFKGSPDTGSGRPLLGAPAAFALPASSASSLSRPLLHAGLAQSLKNLGCSHILDSYMTALSRSDVGSYHEIADTHYEAAWRATQWALSATPDSTTAATAASALASWPSAGGAAASNQLLDDSMPDFAVADGTETSIGLHACIYHSVRALHALVRRDPNEPAFRRVLSVARQSVVQQIGAISAESVQSVFPLVVNLQLLSDIEQSWDIVQRRANRSGSSSIDSKANALIDRWTNERFSSLVVNNFDMCEPILALRGVLLQLAGESPLVLSRHYRSFARFAREANRPHVGITTLRQAATAPRLLQGPNWTKSAFQLEDAQLLWTSGDADAAVRSARQVLRLVPPSAVAGDVKGAAAAVAAAGTDDEVAVLRVDAYCLIGEWLSKSYLEVSSGIKGYLEEAQKVASRCASEETRIDQVHKQSGEFEHKTRLHAYNRKKIDALTRTCQQQARDVQAMPAAVASAAAGVAAKIAQRELNVFILSLEKEYKMDEEEIKLFESNLYSSLEKAVEQYCECLRTGDQYDSVVIYRLVSLWFTHYAQRPVSDTQKRIYSTLKSIATFKWLPLMYQIASRLGAPSAASAATSSPEQKLFRSTVQELIVQIAADHPYHTLYQIYALRHGDKLHSTSKVKDGFEVNQSRIEAAKDVLARVGRHSSRHTAVVAAIGSLINSYIDLGNRGFSKTDRGVKLADTALSRLTVKELALIPVPTASVAIRPAGGYLTADESTYDESNAGERIAMIHKFESEFKFTPTGVNRPLIIRLQGSDGVMYQQLLKFGADDLRQDAVMEQLFQLVNTQLSATAETRARQLHIRTYNVVPLTPCVGLVEWVQHTISLADLLTKQGIGAHDRYRPARQTRSYTEWHNELHNRAGDKASLPAVFTAACADMPPVFHRYFFDSWSEPQVWFQKRLAYTRSVAVASMCGYILGLGDRHNANILLDKHTAELVHIDLGVAFDLGRVLKTPEIVPFRLTRDIVDPMGVTGVEGVFRRCCEETMRVLRANEEMLLTVLEVFVHDPLYKWALSPQQMDRLRPLDAPAAAAAADSSSAAASGSTAAAIEKVDDELLPLAGGASNNIGAHRAMMAVTAKLRGTDRGGVLSVEGAVRALINEACDPNNLCYMYWGWSPIT